VPHAGIDKLLLPLLIVGSCATVAASMSENSLFSLSFVALFVGAVVSCLKISGWAE
jgi:hypothetical protein